MIHKFHIPVLGLGFSIDTPLKVARYGISSVVSIVDDELVERMRAYHCRQNNIAYHPILKHDIDARARRITAYLNLLNDLVDRQFNALCQQQFYTDSDLDRYFLLLPEEHALKQGYDLLAEFAGQAQRTYFENLLRKRMVKGAIDVNIMSKVDKMNYNARSKFTADENTDALAAFRGFAESDLCSSIILSAGMNQRLFNYIEGFADFFPAEGLPVRKKLIIKVNDYRSAYLQARMLAKKGLWVSEFRIESGLNCGGHAFATDGILLGPILEEFMLKRSELQTELFSIYKDVLLAKGIESPDMPSQRVSVQGGIGTSCENEFLLKYYKLDATGWGSPFLLVPETTNVDGNTLKHLIEASRDDFYLSNASPLGVLFNNFKQSTINQLQKSRIAKGQPGSPCTKKYLVSNTEFTNEPICTASRQYQSLKIAQLNAADISDDERHVKIEEVTEKICLCEGLCSSAYIKNGMLKQRENTAVAVCPGPNLAYFSGIFSLEEMTGHIYGKVNLLSGVDRPNLFVNELRLYINYLLKNIEQFAGDMNEKKVKYFAKFKGQLLAGINYYKILAVDIRYPEFGLEKMMHELMAATNQVLALEY